MSSTERLLQDALEQLEPAYDNAARSSFLLLFSIPEQNRPHIATAWHECNQAHMKLNQLLAAVTMHLNTIAEERAAVEGVYVEKLQELRQAYEEQLQQLQASQEYADCQSLSAKRESDRLFATRMREAADGPKLDGFWVAVCVVAILATGVWEWFI